MCRSKWDSLPHHLSNLVIEQLEDSFNEFSDPNGALKAILLLRLISKSWKAAASHYVGKLSFEPQQPSDVPQLNKVLPYISKLWINGNIDTFHQYLAASGGPSSLRYLQPCRDESLLDVSSLPMSLVGLRLSKCQVRPGSCEHFRADHLTSLYLDQVQNLPAEKHQLLQFLPKLQVTSQATMQA